MWSREIALLSHNVIPQPQIQWVEPYQFYQHKLSYFIQIYDIVFGEYMLFFFIYHPQTISNALNTTSNSIEVEISADIYNNRYWT